MDDIAGKCLWLVNHHFLLCGSPILCTFFVWRHSLLGLKDPTRLSCLLQWSGDFITTDERSELDLICCRLHYITYRMGGPAFPSLRHRLRAFVRWAKTHSMWCKGALDIDEQLDIARQESEPLIKASHVVTRPLRRNAICKRVDIEYRTALSQDSALHDSIPNDRLHWYSSGGRHPLREKNEEWISHLTVRRLAIMCFCVDTITACLNWISLLGRCPGKMVKVTWYWCLHTCSLHDLAHP